jgi:PIF1 helicase.
MKIVDVLTEKVYPDISNISTMPLNWFQVRAIILPTNEQLKDFIPSKFEASSQIYHLVDTIVHREEEVHYPTEFLNSLTPPRIQPLKLMLK